MITKETNLSIWEALATTDKKFTKEFKRSGGFSGTDINPQWRMMRLTEVFGPVGVGWGYDVDKVWAETIGGEVYHFAMLRLWYDHSGERAYTGPQVGGTPAGRTPDEGYKMAVTDALGKCASQLGLGADVYLGQFDGKYSRPEPARTETRPANGAEKPQRWQDVVVHFGPKKDKKLGDLPDKDLFDFATYYHGKNPTEESCRSTQDRWLWRGLRAAVDELEAKQAAYDEAAVEEDSPF